MLFDKAKQVDGSVIVLAPALVALALWSVPTAIQGGDAGEFATVLLKGGVPHPSGYPWMRALGLLARPLWSLGLPPATAAALPPAMCGVVAWLLVHRCLATLGHRWLGALVVWLAAAAPLSVIHVNDSEVWGPHLLFSALFLHTVIHTRARPRPFLLGLCLGLAISHHLTAALLLPLAIGAALPHGPPRSRAWLIALLRNGALGVAGGCLGLLPYASLAIGRGGGWRWGYTETFDGWLAHVLRRDFGTFSLSLHDEPVEGIDGVGRALSSIAEVFTAELGASPVLGLCLSVLAFVGAFAWLRGQTDTNEPPVRVAVGVGWALSWAASGLAFPAAGNIDPHSPFGAWILERFDLLTVLLLVLPSSLAVAALVRVVAARLEAARRVASVGAAAIVAGLLFAEVLAVLERGRPADERGVERAAIDVVETPDDAGPAIVAADGTPIRAIVFGTEDHRSFPILYVQEVLGAGPHTLYVDAGLLAYPWYRARLRQRLPSLPDADKPLKMIGEIWTDPNLAHVPIYFANVFSRPADRLYKVPEGLLWRIPPAAELGIREGDEWTLERVIERHLAACGRMSIRPQDFGGLTHPRGHPWSADLWHAYVDKSQAVEASLRAYGRSDLVSAVRGAIEAHVGDIAGLGI